MSGEPGGVVTPVFSTWSCGMYDVEEDKENPCATLET
jgi:hypothetical protein